MLFIGKNIAKFPNLVPQLLLFLCKFDFSYFFGFFLSTSTRMRKIGDFKTNALKVKRVPKIFENLNSFKTILKMLKMMLHILKNVFFGFSLFFTIFGFFKNFIKKVGQKLGNNTNVGIGIETCLILALIMVLKHGD
jgi:hypothetical protein